MICPHCRKTIPEQKRYLMSRDPEGGYVWSPAARWVALYFLLFLILVGGFAIVTRHIH